MDNKTEVTSSPSISGSILYFSFVVLASSFILWIFVCLLIKLDSIPMKQLPESLLYPIYAFIFIPAFLNNIAGRCLKSIPMGKYTKSIGIFLILIIAYLLISYVGTLEITFIKGALLK